MRVDEANDVAAIAVFTAAREHNQTLTMDLVRSVLAAMTDREAATKARATAVYFTVRAWQSSLEASRRKALR